MDNFPACLAFTLSQEGGYSDDPNDSGGATNLGITLGEYALWTRRADVTKVDMQVLTVATVTPIYRASYWQANQCQAMPAGVALMVFDHGVNRGVGNAARALQQALGVDADMHIGPQTLLALRGADNIRALVNQMHALQLAQYQALTKWPDYGRGWGARCDRRRDAALAMAATR